MQASLSDLNPRQQRGLALAKASRIKQLVAHTFLVPSQSHNSGGYVVDTEKGTCSCPDHELRGATITCKHRWAVEFSRHRVTASDGSTATVETMRVTYSQDWPAYNAAQCEEKDRVQVLLKALCESVHNPPQVGRGRRNSALSDIIFAATIKTYVGLSGRRASSDIRACVEKGFIDKAPSYNTIFDYVERPELTPVLKRLLRASAVPLASLESAFAIDGTGFGSKVYRRWFDAKYGREMKQATWVKLHAICGTTTNIITAVEVTDANVNDSPLLPQLVRETAEGFRVEEVSADKGYLAASNFEAIESVGAKPFIAFKHNSKPRGPDVWRRAYLLFSLYREEWLEHYHRRSRIESVFSAVKRKFGGHVRSKLPDANGQRGVAQVSRPQPLVSGPRDPRTRHRASILRDEVTIQSDLTKEEQANVRTVLHFLHTRFEGWLPLAKALGTRPDALSATARRGSVTASLTYRVARLVGAPIDDVLSGKYPPPNACPYCGHVAEEVK